MCAAFRDEYPGPPSELVLGDPTGIPLVVIVGPTASGKSALALQLAEHQRGAIVSADSRQVYQGFDIGTAKPTAREQNAVPHDLIDVVSPEETFSVKRFQSLAKEAIAHRRSQGYLPLLVGGTGLYVRAVLDGLSLPVGEPNSALRASLAKLENLHEQLSQVDPVTAARLHPNDRVRLIRALEVYHLTKTPISELQRTEACPYRLLMIGVGVSRPRLFEAIDARVERMLDAGFEAEVARLGERWGWGHPLLATLGYAEIARFLQGQCSRDEAIALMAQHTRQYAKRQLTWFRADSRVHWLSRDPAEPIDAVALKAGQLIQRWVIGS